MTMGIIHDQNHIAKKPILIRNKNNNMGCMAGVFNLGHLLSGKRFHPKRLPPINSPSPPSSTASPQSSTQQQQPPMEKSSLPPPEVVKSPWKFSRDAPRLSLDSRFAVDPQGSLHPREPNLSGCEKPTSSPGVIARLMGLEPLPAGNGGGGSGTSPDPDPNTKLQLRRSASDSRCRDLLLPTYAFIDSKSFLSSPKIDKFNQTNHKLSTNAAAAPAKSNHSESAINLPERMTRPVLQQHQHQSRPRMLDFFPMHEEPSKDLEFETVKQMLETIQLKGLLHSNPTVKQNGHRNFIVVMKPPTSLESPPRKEINRHNVSNLNIATQWPPSRSPRRERPRTNANENRRRIPVPAATKQSPEQRRASPGQSPRVGSRSVDQGASRSPRRRRSTAGIRRYEKSTVMRADDEASNVSESSYSTCSHTTDAESWRMEEHSDGRSLLERCDSLLNSIAEMTAKTTPAIACSSISGGANVTELQPSPVSVLDSSFRKKDDDESPSPVLKRTIDFKEEAEQVVELEDPEMMCSPSSSVFQPNNGSDTSDLAYISEILQTSDYLLPNNHTDLFLSPDEQQLLKGNDASRSSRIKRRLIFDSINEILDQNQQLPPWKAAASAVGNSFLLKPSSTLLWSELRGIKEPDPSDGMFNIISGVIKKDLANDSTSGWGDLQVKMSDMVLDIERLIFKDLIGETIQNLAISSHLNAVAAGAAPRWKLVF